MVDHSGSFRLANFAWYPKGFAFVMNTFTKNYSHTITAILLGLMIVGWVIMLTLSISVPISYQELLFAFAGVFTTISGVKIGSSGSGSNPQLGT